jgi:hypothetical protein
VNAIGTQDQQIVLWSDKNVIAGALDERTGEMLQFLSLNLLLDKTPPLNAISILEAADAGAVTS